MCSLGRRSVRRRSLWVMMVVVVMVMVMFVTDFRVEQFTKFNLINGLSNDRCNGSSSENECNGKFNLNHF